MNNNKGFTLLEALIAMLILAILMLGALQGLLAAQTYVDRNQLRDEAVRIVDEELTDFRNTDYSDASLTAGTYNSTIDKQIRSYLKTYSISTEITDVNPVKSIEVTVTWSHKGENYSYIGTSIKGDI